MKRRILNLSLAFSACSAVALPAFADAIDLKFKAGYTEENNISSTFNPGGTASTTADISGVLKGYNVGVSALVPLIDTPIITPVLGGGVVFTQAKNTENYATGIPGINNVDVTVTNSNMSAELNAGIKVKLFPISVYGLVNGGYGFYNDLNERSNAAGVTINSPSIDNHFYYGGTVGASLQLLPTFHLGVELTDNHHFL